MSISFRIQETSACLRIKTAFHRAQAPVTRCESDSETDAQNCACSTARRRRRHHHQLCSAVYKCLGEISPTRLSYQVSSQSPTPAFPSFRLSEVVTQRMRSLRCIMSSPTQSVYTTCIYCSRVNCDYLSFASQDFDILSWSQ